MLRKTALACLVLVALTWALENRANRVEFAPNDAITQKISYQGYLTDPAGTPITATLAMTFRIFDLAVGGTQLWTEIYGAISVQNGFYDVLLGNTTAIPLSVFTPAGARRWLEVVVAGSTMSPRIEIAAAGYAFKASDADAISGNDMTALDARYVNERQANSITSGMIVKPCTLSGSAGGSAYLLHILPNNDGGINVTRTSTGTTNPAVKGEVTSGSGHGVLGRATGSDGASVGVKGQTDASRPGIFGHSGTGVVLAPAVAAGVAGYSATGPAFYVDNTGTYGLHVKKSGSYGVRIDSATGVGIYVKDASGYGIHMYSCGGNGVCAESTPNGYSGFYARYPGNDGFRVWQAMNDGFSVGYGATRHGLYVSQADNAGVYVSNANVYGVYANSNTQRGGYFRNNNNSYYAQTAWNNTGTGGTVKGLYVQGHGYATGGWQTFLSDGRPGFAPISPEQEVIFSGSATLTDGRAQVAFDPAVRGALSPDVPLRVIVTPTTECNGVCVANKSAQGFSVKELMSGKSAASFDWIVIGRMKGYEQRPNTQPIKTDEAPRSELPRAEDNPPQED